jgi:hypothetical protein
LNTLLKYNIGIADDGLKDTGVENRWISFVWKSNNYNLLNISLDNFKESVNYELLSTRSSFLELPDKIESLLKDKKYLR